LKINGDFQQTSGSGKNGIAFEIKDGKRVAIIGFAAPIYRSTELWKNILQIGGPKSVVRNVDYSVHGEPQQYVPYTILAVPMAVKDMTVIDWTRKA